MSVANNNNWNLANQSYLMAALQNIRQELLEYYAILNESELPTGKQQAQKTLVKAAADLPFPSALDRLTNVLGLSDFERKIILMCAGIELDAHFSTLITSIQGNSDYPSFSLAFSVFPEAHWSAIAPTSPLRYWQLIRLNEEEHVTKSPLRIDEHILHYLTGVSYLDQRLEPLIYSVPSDQNIVSSHVELAQGIVDIFSSNDAPPQWPIIHLGGDNESDKEMIAACACSMMNLNLYALPMHVLPTTTQEIKELANLWDREAALNASALFLDCADLDTSDKPKLQLVKQFIEKVQGVLLLGSKDWAPQFRRSSIELQVTKPDASEQLVLWKQGLGKRANRLNKSLEKVVSHFDLSVTAITKTVQELSQHPITDKEQSPSLADKIWEACCINTRPKVDELAQRIEPVAGWDDLVLPTDQKQILKEIVLQVQYRNKVYQEWGFTSKGPRGLGISALFSGESGTGKTMASEVLANELKLDLYKIDLSQVVNKYIGETEKNLKRIFDAAEEGGAILLFDEADALFGKRSDVKDSHDRYSNIEVSYLLQRMEAYRGLAVLTTNMKNAIDQAFLRRIRFVVRFPYPTANDRAEIWRRVFPVNAPVKGLDLAKLARLSIPGGNIRNIALNAAFIAAGEDKPVQMHHILQAARSEYNKLEKPLSNSEIEGWT